MCAASCPAPYERLRHEPHPPRARPGPAVHPSDGTLTLGDLWPGPHDARLWCAVVGGKTAPDAILNGHYYHGPIGRRQMDRLLKAGLFSPTDAEFQDLQAAAHGVGFMNLSQIPRSHDDPGTLALMREGSARVEAELAARGVELVISMWRHGTRELLGHEGRPGLQASTTSWGAEVFRMPSPYARAVEAVAVMDELRDWLEANHRLAPGAI